MPAAGGGGVRDLDAATLIQDLAAVDQAEVDDLLIGISAESAGTSRRSTSRHGKLPYREVPPLTASSWSCRLRHALRYY
jgi:hypothetical protein